MASNSKIKVRGNIVINGVDDMVFRGISSIVEKQNVGTWIGTMTELTTALNRVLSRKQRSLLPRSPSALRVAINKVVNRLRNRGIGVRFGRTTDHARTRYVRFTR
jgi:hypothetical protein